MFLDRLVERRRIFEWRDAKLSVEDADTLAILSQCRRAVSRPVVELHQCPLGVFVEGVERQPPARMTERVAPIARVTRQRHEPVEHLPELVAKPVAKTARKPKTKSATRHKAA